MRFIRRIPFLVFSGILIGYIILLPPEIVYYEECYMEPYVLMNLIATSVALIIPRKTRVQRNYIKHNFFKTLFAIY